MRTAEQLLSTLIDLAQEQRSLLEQESWEQAIVVRELYDTAFEELRAQGRSLTPEHRAQLERLDALHAENLALAEVLLRNAGNALAGLGEASKLLGYSPVGADTVPSPRYLDQSA